MVVVSSGTETERVASYRFRSLINRAAAELMPDRYPAPRPDGRRYPQTVLSGTFIIGPMPEVIDHDGYRELTRRFEFVGQGWGHQVGMSQFGALALAEEGVGYSDILAHYYGGLRPQPASAWLPDPISVGLVVEADEVNVLAEGGAFVLIDGESAAEPALAVWTFRPDGSSVSTALPIGIGTAPRVLASRMLTRPAGDVLRFQLTAPGFVTVTTSADGVQIGRKALGLVAGGEFEFFIGELTSADIVGDKRLAIAIAVTSPLGGDRRVLVRVPERR
jgi:hypothetical protein